MTWSSHAQEGNKTRSEDRKPPDIHVAQKLKLITLQLGHCFKQAPQEKKQQVKKVATSGLWPEFPVVP